MGIKEISGKTFGRLTVINLVERRTRQQKSLWLCRCECGNTTTVVSGNLTSGNTKSCGCLGDETRVTRQITNTRHGLSSSPEYRIWNAMIQRCNNPNCKAYSGYGGRGIRVFPEWGKFISFYDYVGPRPTNKHQIDRINNDGNYEPGNVRWVLPKENSLNKGKFGVIRNFTDEELIKELERRGYGEYKRVA